MEGLEVSYEPSKGGLKEVFSSGAVRALVEGAGKRVATRALSISHFHSPAEAGYELFKPALYYHRDRFVCLVFANAWAVAENAKYNTLLKAKGAI